MHRLASDVQHVLNAIMKMGMCIIMCCMVKVVYLPNVWAWGLLQLAVSAYNSLQIQQSIPDVKTKSQGFLVPSLAGLYQYNM